VLVDLFGVARVDAEQGEMAGDAVDHAQFAAGDELLLGGAVADEVSFLLGAELGPLATQPPLALATFVLPGPSAPSPPRR
jgi:hypothetical protein